MFQQKVLEAAGHLEGSLSQVPDKKTFPFSLGSKSKNDRKNAAN